MRGSKRAVILYGPPGSGKGTQAELLVRRLGFIHFDTGAYCETLFYAPGADTNPVIRREKKNFEDGRLVSPPWILSRVREATQRIARSGSSIVFSGSPRTLFEAFGDKRNAGLMETLVSFYGKKNIYIIAVQVPDRVSVARNSARSVCSVCKTPAGFLRKKGERECSFCGALLKKRTLDKSDVIRVRVKEYLDRTYPIMRELRKQKYRIALVDGTPKPFRVFEKIAKLLL